MAVEVGARAIGARVKRVEDPRILTGRGRYVDDVVLPGMLHARLPPQHVPHGRLRSVDVDEARRAAGRRRGVHRRGHRAAHAAGGRRVRRSGMNLIPGLQVAGVLRARATDKVRHVGDPIALVVAESRYIAEDALELIVEDIELLDPIVTYEDALDPSKPPLFDEVGDNIDLRRPSMAFGDVDGRVRRTPTGSCAPPSRCTATSPCRWSAAALIADWDAATRSNSRSTPRRSRRTCCRMLLPVAGRRADGAHPRAGRRRRRRVRSEERRHPRGRRRGRGVHRPRPPGQVDRGPPRAPGHAGPAPRGDGRHRGGDHRRRACILGVRMDVKVNVGRLPVRPVPGRDAWPSSIVGFVPGPDQDRGPRRDVTAVFSNKATVRLVPGPWATGDFLRERLARHRGPRARHRPVEVRRRNYVERGRAAARRC